MLAISMLVAALAGAPALAAPPKKATGMEAKLTANARFVLAGVQFQGMTAKLSDSSRLPLIQLVAVLKKHPETRLEIQAFVDATDPNALGLSQNRAKAVVARMVQLGAPKATLKAVGMGGKEALVPSIVPALKAKNRRVQVRVLTPPGARKAVAAATPSPTRRPETRPTPTPRATPVAITTPAATPTPVAIATPAPTPVPTPALRPAADRTAARVILVTTRGTAAGTGPRVSATLRRAGADVVRVAEVREQRPATTIYHLPEFGAEATRLRAATGLADATLVSVKRIDPQTGLMIVLGGNERRRR